MKTNDFKKELQQLSTQQMGEVLDGLQREMFKLKLNASTMHLKDYSLFKKIKRNIARVLTCINAKSK